MREAVARRTAHANDINTQLANGYLRFYTGTRPTDADTALGAAVLVATLRFGATAGTVTNGVFTANAITQDSNAAGNAGVSVTFARLFQSDGTTAVCDISAGTSGTEAILASASIAAGNVVTCSSCVFTVPVGT